MSTPTKTQTNRKIRRLIVHHSAGPITESVDQVRRFHMAAPPAGRGWSDIAYHWYVWLLPGGVWTVSPGRPEEREGGHDAGQNADSIGVCIAGDYTKGPVDPDAWMTLVALVASICRRYGLTSNQVEGHKENEPASTPTACPGFDPACLREAVRRQLQEGEAGIGTTTGLYATT